MLRSSKRRRCATNETVDTLHINCNTEATIVQNGKNFLLCLFISKNIVHLRQMSTTKT